MRLTFGVLSLVIALAVTGYLARAQLSGQGAKAPPPAQVASQAQQVAALASLQQAAAGLEQFKALNATYAGAPVPRGARLTRADAVSYCLEAGGRHLAGPGGTPRPGLC
jgi:hypothetical protein